MTSEAAASEVPAVVAAELEAAERRNATLGDPGCALDEAADGSRQSQGNSTQPIWFRALVSMPYILTHHLCLLCHCLPPEGCAYNCQAAKLSNVQVRSCSCQIAAVTPTHWLLFYNDNFTCSERRVCSREPRLPSLRQSCSFRHRVGQCTYRRISVTATRCRQSSRYLLEDDHFASPGVQAFRL